MAGRCFKPAKFYFDKQSARIHRRKSIYVRHNHHLPAAGQTVSNPVAVLAYVFGPIPNISRIRAVDSARVGPATVLTSFGQRGPYHAR
jgi:hypothetical protein